MSWLLSTPADPVGRALADRHYSRRTVGATQFCAPGKKVVLVGEDRRSVWVSLLQVRAATKHAWPGAWVCSLFRNESQFLSSLLILDAIARTVDEWGPLPPEGMITFVDAERTSGRRSKRALPGECFRWAGFTEIGSTPAGHGRSAKVVLGYRCAA